MKTLILLIALSFSSFSFADTTLPASNDTNILTLIVGVHSTYSETSSLEARALEYVAGDGMNAVRIALVLSAGYGDAKVFELDQMLAQVKTIAFVAKDTIAITYSQDTFDAEENQIQVEKTIVVKAVRNADGTLANSVKLFE